ncbi:MAG: 30S ribosome-binding factor RbfA [Verrucomicrobia bacterium]|nr:30S ribosome-binding factor RbfA [Verrucomicrobiota bacterium]
MPHRRLDRVNEMLKRSLGEIVRREFAIETAGLITVNDVEVAPDLQTATVYIGVIGSPQQRHAAIPLLDKHRARIQSLMAADIVLRYTPVLRFLYDDSVERGNRVLTILEEVEKTLPKEEPKR